MNQIAVPWLTLPDGSYRWWALAISIIGNFMGMLDTSIVNIALPKMMAVFSVNSQDAQWILTSYMLTMAIMQPVSGALCDMFGTRRMYLFSLAVFTIGSALCGTAWSNASLVVFRVIQAIGGGLIFPVTMMIIYHNFPREERYRAMSIWGLSAMAAPAVGPALGGYIVEYLNWRLIFTINVPVGIAGFILAALILRDKKSQRGGKFDGAGFAVSTIGLFSLLLALNKGVEAGWSSPYILTLFFIAFSCLALFVAIELDHDNPVLDLRVFKNRNFCLSAIVLFFGTTGLYGGLYMVPLYMETVRGFSAMQTGMVLLPAALTSGLVMPVAAFLAKRIGPKPVVITGIIILGAASVPLAQVDMQTSLSTITAAMVLRGTGLGLFVMTATTLGINALPLTQISRATAMKNVIRQISGSFGIALLSTVIQKRQATVFAYDDAFFLLAVICFCALIPAVFLTSLRKSSAKNGG